VKSKVVRGAEVAAHRYGVLAVKALLPEAGDFSVTLVEVDGENDRIRNTKSDSAYYVIDGHGTFHLDDEAFEVDAGDLVVIPRNGVHQYAGRLTLLSISSPPFDFMAVESVARS
jgi:mannose-6-phosphate isomerase-like protein (cupin superfamily)